MHIYMSSKKNSKTKKFLLHFTFSHSAFLHATKVPHRALCTFAGNYLRKFGRFRVYAKNVFIDHL